MVRLGKYEVFQHLATGGMGAVYRARDTEAGREVALKVLPPELAAKKGMLERFRREARSAAKLHHENIVTLFESGELNGTFYLAMEFVEGVDLHDHVKKLGPFEPEEARQIILQAARALQHADEYGIIHRDIKPSNFLLQRRNGKLFVKLLDFGLAREVDADDFRVTRAGTTVGTVDYMAPEQARDSGAADIRSDLYSLGSTWYHLLAGRAPFPEGGLGERLVKIMHDEPPDIRQINPSVSDETWEVLSTLLAKDPRERYQTPALLIDALLSLEGKSVARPRLRLSKPAPTKVRPATKLKTPMPRVIKEEPEKPEPSPRLWYALAAVVTVLMLGVILIALSMPRKNPESDSGSGAGDGTLPPVVNSGVATSGPIPKPPLPGQGAAVQTPTPTPTPPAPANLLRVVSSATTTLDLPALRSEVEKPWANLAPVPASATVVRVARTAELGPLSFRSLAQACQAGEPGKPLVVEIHDNGPLIEVPGEAVSGRDLVIRAGEGFRPLVVWDLPTTLARQAGKSGGALAFLRVGKGRLWLQGLEVVLRWPENATAAARLLDLDLTELHVQDCTFSAAGKPAGGITLARLVSAEPGARVRFTRCQVRGAGWTALDVEAPEAEVLFDGCLVVGGTQPLLRAQVGSKKSQIRAVRSTFVSGANFLELRPTGGEANPAFAWLGWDSLVSSSTGSGTLLALLDRADTRNMVWRGCNCVYAGWRELLTGATPVAADLAAWHRHWADVGNDTLSPGTWPDQIYTELASQAAASYQPTGPVLYGASVAREQPLGCPVATLPPARDGWIAMVFDPVLTPPELLSDEAAPPIPPVTDGLWTGATIDLAAYDLGAELAKLQTARRLAPQVVLHLRGKGEHSSSPIRLKGVHLTLHFEEPADKETPPITLNLARTSGSVPLIDLEEGSLDVIGGTLRVPDQSTLKVSQVIRVRGGNLRLFRTRIEGPQQSTPEGFQAAITVVGSGDPLAEKARSVVINESVIVSSRAGLDLVGIGLRLAVAQSVIVAGSDALHFTPGKAFKGRAATQVFLTHVTLAGRRAVVGLSDPGAGEMPTEPIYVQAKECAYLNPFPGRPSKAGILACEGEALSRGLLLWQGEREGFDIRLFFAAAPVASIGEKKEGYAPWKQLWGPAAVREPRELALLPAFEARRWPLERLMLKSRQPPGANLERLGLTPRKPMPPR
ncbi:MAG: serine/threonine-protein kinase [Gemmataceae bacterium]